ncbi:MAG: glycerol-3-phosphate 1-O-acyltransferase PlsY [Bacillota bacterium]|jgi:glycerol-3-phosphate acyltransferase PlsY|nr:glycerol-3-phosphate 1-O-acyltransferase PlsY [Bacillota bacterium]NLJ01874.1 glycerol-3-phosphate 1-O-acyltransferase PlsY [Bacillota bacterium]
MKHILILAASYLLGSIPFGLLIAKWWAKVDVRQHGSGNIGMTNVLRTTGAFCAALTLIGDMGKGMAAVLIARHFAGGGTFPLVAGLAAVFGHNWPIFLRFKGGKGVATIAGLLVAYKPWVAGVLVVIWLAVLIASRYISLASIVVAVCLPLVLAIFGTQAAELLLALIMAAVTVFRHRSNIERLRTGTEFRFGEKAS